MLVKGNMMQVIPQVAMEVAKAAIMAVNQAENPIKAAQLE